MYIWQTKNSLVNLNLHLVRNKTSRGHDNVIIRLNLFCIYKIAKIQQ